MNSILAILATLLVLFLGAWFAFWLIDRCDWPAVPPAPPFKLILQVIVMVIFLGILLGIFGVYGPTFHPLLFHN